MSVVLRHGQSGWYYAGPRRWVANPEMALDLGTIEDAVAASRQPEFVGIELLACAGYPDCDWVLALRRPDPGYSEAVRTWHHPIRTPLDRRSPDVVAPPPSRLPPLGST